MRRLDVAPLHIRLDAQNDIVRELIIVASLSADEEAVRPIGGLRVVQNAGTRQGDVGVEHAAAKALVNAYIESGPSEDRLRRIGGRRLARGKIGGGRGGDREKNRERRAGQECCLGHDRNPCLALCERRRGGPAKAALGYANLSYRGRWSDRRGQRAPNQVPQNARVFLTAVLKLQQKLLFSRVEFGLGRLTFRRSIALTENQSTPLAAGACSAWRLIDRQGLVVSNRPSRRKNRHRMEDSRWPPRGEPQRRFGGVTNRFRPGAAQNRSTTTAASRASFLTRDAAFRIIGITSSTRSATR